MRTDTCEFCRVSESKIKESLVEQICEELDNLPWPEHNGIQLVLLPGEWASIAKQQIKDRFSKNKGE